MVAIHIDIKLYLQYSVKENSNSDILFYLFYFFHATPLFLENVPKTALLLSGKM